MSVARSLRRMGVLLFGMTVAQLLTLAVTPLLGRYFGPAEFGVLGLVNGIAAPLVAVAALRFDLAIVLPEDDARGAEVLVLSLLCTLLTTLAVSLGVALGRAPLAALFETPELAEWLWACPPIVLLGGAHAALGYWVTRQKEFGWLSGVALGQSLATVGAQVAGGLARLGAAGLVLGVVLGKALGALTLGLRVAARDRALLAAVRTTGVARAAREYADFPRLQAPTTVLNHAMQYLPVYVVGAYFGRDAVGQLAFALMVLTVPVTLVLGAVRQVLLQEGSELWQGGEGLAPLWRRWTLALLGAGLPIALGLALYAPELFSLVFGARWLEAGKLAQPMAPWLLTGVANAPTSALFPVLRLNRLMWIWQLASFAVAAATTFVVARATDAWTTTAAYCGTMIVLNVLIAVLVYRAALRERPRRTDAPAAG